MMRRTLSAVAALGHGFRRLGGTSAIVMPGHPKRPRYPIGPICGDRYRLLRIYLPKIK